MEKVRISTLESLPGYSTREFRGLVWASSAKSKQHVKDFVEVLRSVLGRDVEHYRHFKDARSEVLHKLARHAREAGANAVLGVRIQSMHILPSTMDIYAYGSAVIVEKDHSERKGSSKNKAKVTDK